MNKNIGIIGAGKWGTAIAHLLSLNDNNIRIWSRNIEIVTSINCHNENDQYYPGITLSNKISATTDVNEVIVNSDFVFLVIPVQHIRDFLTKNQIAPDIPIIMCAKGIEISSLKLPTAIAKEFVTNELLVMSGPNFADEIINNLPTATNLAGSNDITLRQVSDILNSKNFRCYMTSDITGTEICSAVKNVIAIAAGICEGKNLGNNAKAALLTIGLREIITLIEKIGGHYKTIYSLAGIGDMMLTCSSKLSRNMSFGYSLAKGNILDTNYNTVEGVHTCMAINKLKSELNVEMPVCEAIYNIVHQKANLNLVINELLSRPFNKNIAYNK